jgi:hypothetical protein
MFDVWAMAMVCHSFSLQKTIITVHSQLKGEEHATLEKPPSHCLFNSNILSPVLQQRKEVQEAKKAATSTNSVGAADILSGFANLATALHAPAPPLVTAQPYPFAPQAMGASSAPLLALLPANRTAGPSLALEDFCSQYQVDDTVRQKLSDEGYKTLHHLQYAMVQELKKAGFQIGEIASLKDTFTRWSLSYN